jgi:hypothetical protein
MKKNLHILASLFIAFGLNAQNSEQISLTPGYSNQSYFSFANGEVGNVDNTNWDLAFSASGYGSTVRINGAMGMNLYTYPNGDITDWASVDTSCLSTWSSQINSDTDWSVGAFDQQINAADPFDLGWGVYSPITHFITGDSLYIATWIDGSAKKIQLTQLASGTYDFTYADLDGTNEMTASVSKDDFDGKNFGYYSISNNSDLDREPLAGDWDIVFTKYVTELYPGMNYGVTGALVNAGYSVAKSEGVPVTDADPAGLNFGTEINGIGYDWKSFNMTTFQYDLEEDLAYFVRNDGSGEIWKINFTSFDGSSTGNIEFNTELISAAGQFEHSSSTTFTLYPNPSSGRTVNLIYDISSIGSMGQGFILDMNGQVVFDFSLENGGLHNKSLHLEHLRAGAYMVSYQVGSEVLRQKLMLH